MKGSKDYKETPSTKSVLINIEPTLCFRGFDNDVYYFLEKDRSRYADYTGAGNTLNTNRSVVRRMILDSLR